RARWGGHGGECCSRWARWDGGRCCQRCIQLSLSKSGFCAFSAARKICSGGRELRRKGESQGDGANKTKAVAVAARFLYKAGISDSQVGPRQTRIRLQPLRYKRKICRCKRLHIWQQSKRSVDR